MENEVFFRLVALLIADGSALAFISQEERIRSCIISSSERARSRQPSKKSTDRMRLAAVAPDGGASAASND